MEIFGRTGGKKQKNKYCKHRRKPKNLTGCMHQWEKALLSRCYLIFLLCWVVVTLSLVKRIDLSGDGLDLERAETSGRPLSRLALAQHVRPRIRFQLLPRVAGIRQILVRRWVEMVSRPGWRGPFQTKAPIHVGLHPLVLADESASTTPAREDDPVAAASSGAWPLVSRIVDACQRTRCFIRMPHPSTNSYWFQDQSMR